MRKTVLFLAMSLDGFIADRSGGVGWLEGQGQTEDEIDAYAEFITGVDTILMGWNTYHQIVTELSPQTWVYDAQTTYVITHRACSGTERVKFIDRDPASLVRQLRQEQGKDIWICGGAQIVQQLVRENLIDCYDITIVPTLLGSGIRLFENGEREIPLKLLRSRCCNGMTELVYVKR